MTFVPPPLPNKPGVYIYKDASNAIIYIGKAKSIKKRVASYFVKHPDSDKTRQLIEDIADVDIIITKTEKEAFLLESKLIRQHKPKYNIQLKDNIRYAYIKVTADKYPRLQTARNVLKDNADYYGPFVSGFNRIQVLKTLNKAFKLRSCKKMPRQVCLYYHIGRCSGPCENKISHADYTKKVQQAKKYLKGNQEDLLKQLETDMKSASKQQNFEQAKELRDALYALQSLKERQSVDVNNKYNQDVMGIAVDDKKYVITVVNLQKGAIVKKQDFKFSDVIEEKELLAHFIPQYYEQRDLPKEIIIPEVEEQVHTNLQEWSEQTKITIPQKGIKKRLLDIATENAMFGIQGTSNSVVRLQQALKLPELPTVMECFDISTIQGKYTVASMVRFIDGKPAKQDYRRFRIKLELDSPDDFASMREVVYRRYTKLKLNNETMPDLIIIDGGKGQLNVATQVLRQLELSIPIISLAKKQEEIFVPGLQNSIQLSKKDEALQLLQQIRDEAHRFAITYHRLLREKLPSTRKLVAK